MTHNPHSPTTDAFLPPLVSTASSPLPPRRSPQQACRPPFLPACLPIEPPSAEVATTPSLRPAVLSAPAPASAVDLAAPLPSLRASPSSSGPPRRTDGEVLSLCGLPPSLSPASSLPARQPRPAALEVLRRGRLPSKPSPAPTGLALRATEILRSRRETTQICVAILPFPKMRALFAYFV